MKEKPDPNCHFKSEDEPVKKSPWFEIINPKEVCDILPILTSRSMKGQGVRIPIPVHNSTEVIATMIRERCPQLRFKINLDVYRSMLYAGRQLFEYVFLTGDATSKKSKRYQMHKILEAVDTEMYDIKWLEETLDKLMEGYLSQGQGHFSRDKILGTIEELKPLLSPELQARCDNFIDEELDSESVKSKVKERIRKREYRERRKNISLVE